MSSLMASSDRRRFWKQGARCVVVSVLTSRGLGRCWADDERRPPVDSSKHLGAVDGIPDAISYTCSSQKRPYRSHQQLRWRGKHGNPLSQIKALLSPQPPVDVVSPKSLSQQPPSLP